LYIRNRKKPLQNTTESITQYSYRAYPLAKRIHKKLKKMKKKSQHNPAISIVPYPPKQSRETRKSVLSRHAHQFNPAKHARTEQRRKKIRTAPPPTPAKGPNILVPARHSTQRRLTHANMYVTRPARKIPTSPIDPIKEDGT
jgi:hypothetical protein